MIEVRGLSRSYGDVVALDDASFDVQRGEVVGLLGHNGAGKTTMMKVLTGYLEPSAGSASLDGLDVVADRAEVQRRLGYLPENAPLYDDMLVQEYLLMMAELRGVPEAEREPAVARAIRRTGLQAHLLHPIATLSKGFRQRVGIAQAIVHSPDLLVLDEPTNGLDPTQIQAIRELVRSLAEHSTVLLSTHILQEVEAVCDRVLVLIDGRLATDAPLDRLRRSDAVRLALAAGAGGVEERLGAIDGVVQVERAETAGDTQWWRLRTENGSATVPEIVRAGVEAGWSIRAVGPEQRTLEAVFQRLQQEHAARQEQAR